jgi:hypothetical protein
MVEAKREILYFYIIEVAVRILFVIPYVPSPIRVRSYQLIKALSLDHEISLVALLCDEYEWDMAKDVARYCTLEFCRAFSCCFRQTGKRFQNSPRGMRIHVVLDMSGMAYVLSCVI